MGLITIYCPGWVPKAPVTNLIKGLDMCRLDAKMMGVRGQVSSAGYLRCNQSRFQATLPLFATGLAGLGLLGCAGSKSLGQPTKQNRLSLLGEIVARRSFCLGVCEPKESDAPRKKRRNGSVWGKRLSQSPSDVRYWPKANMG